MEKITDLNGFTPKHKTEELLLLNAENIDKPVEQTKTKTTKKNRI